MQLMILDAVDMNWLKCAQANMQSDLGAFDAALTDSVNDLRGEMQACSRSSYRTSLARVDSLVTFPI